MARALRDLDELLDGRAGPRVRASRFAIRDGDQLHVHSDVSAVGGGQWAPPHCGPRHEVLRRRSQPADHRKYAIGFGIVRLLEAADRRRGHTDLARQRGPAETQALSLGVNGQEECSKVERGLQPLT